MPTVQSLHEQAGERPITMVTAYDAADARAAEAAGVDVLLVGDSVAEVRLGYDSTLPVTVEEMATFVGAVARSTDEPLVVADMPFLSVGVEDDETVRHCGRMLKEAGANAVKLESGPHTVSVTERLVNLGIPVVAHLGLTPQHVNLTGRTRQGDSPADADEICSLARDHAEAGATALVLEHVPDDLAARVTDAIEIPTIGIGAGPATDGQVLVVDDVVGKSETTPPFVQTFGDVRGETRHALEEYVAAVQSGAFPPSND